MWLPEITSLFGHPRPRGGERDGVRGPLAGSWAQCAQRSGEISPPGRRRTVYRCGKAGSPAHKIRKRWGGRRDLKPGRR